MSTPNEFQNTLMSIILTLNVYFLLVWFRLSLACTWQTPDASGIHAIHWRTFLGKQVKNKIIYCTMYLLSMLKRPWSWTKLLPSVSRLRYTNDFTTSLYSPWGPNSENMHEVIFKWEMFTENDILLVPVQTTLTFGLRHTILLSLGNII